MRKILIITAIILFILAGCAPKKAPPPRPPGKVPATQRPYTIRGKTYYPIPSADGYQDEGLASWYGRPFHGRKTASGERYDMHAMTAAHRTLPLGTHVKVTNLKNGRSCRLRINDRGPFVRGRIIDLSFAAAKRLKVVGPGTAPVRVEAVGQPARPGLKAPPPAFRLGPYTVQVGSFINQANAERLRDKLNTAYGPGSARIFVFFDGQKNFHRVWVFRLDSIKEGEARLAKLERDGFGQGFVVALDNN